MESSFLSPDQQAVFESYIDTTSFVEQLPGDDYQYLVVKQALEILSARVESTMIARTRNRNRRASDGSALMHNVRDGR